jgi:catechol 2,3-dioxygenase-like lactoylglutathione lyase family enzyme
MLGSSDLVAFVGTADAVHAKHFYGDVLGLSLESESEFAVVFKAPGATLRVTVVERVQPAPYTVLGWGVEDIVAAIADLHERGVKFAHFDGVEQDKLGIWRSPSGAQVAWFKDPDGNLLSITQD